MCFPALYPIFLRQGYFMSGKRKFTAKPALGDESSISFSNPEKLK